MSDPQHITLNLTLDQAQALSTSVGKTLAAEASKMRRHGKGHVIAKEAARNWGLLDNVDNQLRAEMSEAIEEWE